MVDPTPPVPQKQGIHIPTDLNTIYSFGAFVVSLLVGWHIITADQGQKVIDEANKARPIIEKVVIEPDKPDKTTPPAPVIVVPPTPTPTPTPAPTPAPKPDVTPVPDEDTGKTTPLKLVLTNEQGKPYTSVTVDINSMLQVTLSGAKGKVIWKAVTSGSVSSPKLPQNLGFTIELRDDTAWVEIHAVDLGSGQEVDMRVTANKAPQPPPPNPNPDPAPDNDVKPVKARKLFISVVEDSSNRSQPTGSIMSALATWNSFRDKGHDWRFYDINTTETKGKRAVLAAGGVEPALVLHDLVTGELVTVVPLPTKLKDLEAIIAKYSGA